LKKRKKGGKGEGKKKGEKETHTKLASVSLFCVRGSVRIFTQLFVGKRREGEKKRGKKR